MSGRGLPSEVRYWAVLAVDLVAVALLLVLGFAAPGGGWWFLLAVLWSVVGIRRAAIEVRRTAGELGPADGEWEALGFEAAQCPGRQEEGRVPRGAKAFAAAGVGSLLVLGALLVTAFEPVFAAFGPVRVVVYCGLVVLAAATGLLSVTLSAAGATDPGLPVVRAALRSCAAMGCALLAGLALLAGDSLFGRPEGILAALAVPAAAGLLVVLGARRTRR